MDVLMISPGFPPEMPLFTRGVATVGARVFGIGDQPLEGMPHDVREALVLGDSLIVHIVGGDTVLQYSKPQIGGRVVNGYDPAFKQDGTPLAEGFISLQSEGHPIDFRAVEVLNLKGCTDPEARNFKRYFVVSDPGVCEESER